MNPHRLRGPGEAAVLTAGDITLIRQVLSASYRVLHWAGQHAGPQYRDIENAAVQAAAGEHPSHQLALPGAICLVIDCLDFASPAETQVTSEV